MRVALLGCGGIAPRHVAAAKANGLELVGCCGRDEDRTRAFAAEHGGEAFVDLDRMIDTVAPELLIATLPPFSRSGEIEHAASRGVHLLVEKPIALDMPAADRMVAEVGASGVVAAVGFMYRFGDAIAAWRAADTGRVGLYAGRYHCNALHADWWREEAKSGGQILEQVIHQIDLIRHLVGEPDTVYARRANLFHRDVPRYDVEDASAIVFGWDDGRLATLNASNIGIPGLWYKQWSIYAERMVGTFDSWNDAVLTARDGAAPRAIASDIDPFAAQVADVVHAIRAGTRPTVTLADGAATLRLALAARASADQGRELRVSDAV